MGIQDIFFTTYTSCKEDILNPHVKKYLFLKVGKDHKYITQNITLGIYESVIPMPKAFLGFFAYLANKQ